MRDADLDGFDFRGGGATKGKPVVGNASAAGAVGAPSKLLKQSKNDTISRLPSSSTPGKGSSVPALMASIRDSGKKSRRSSVDNRTQGRRGNRRMPQQAAAQRIGGTDWSFNQLSNGDHTSRQGGANSNGMGASFDPFAMNPSNSMGDATASTTSETTPSRSTGFGSYEEEHEYALDSKFRGGSFGDSNSAGKPSSRSLFSSSGEDGPARMQVNVALNEDLTCHYKLSQMSSCSVDGVIQVRGEPDLRISTGSSTRC